MCMASSIAVWHDSQGTFTQEWHISNTEKIDITLYIAVKWSKITKYLSTKCQRDLISVLTYLSFKYSISKQESVAEMLEIIP